MKSRERTGILLIILYLGFISLGLPDAVLGSAWPAMRHSFGRPLESAGALQTMTTVLSVASSLAAGWLLFRWHTGVIIAASSVMTGCAMYGYAFAHGWPVLLFFTIFFGLGQGAVDAAVNGYMAKHYSARHMNWVHGCWGIGAACGPFIMTSVFSAGYGWRTGYFSIAAAQTILSLVFFSTLGLWGGADKPDAPLLPRTPDGTPGERRLPMRRVYITGGANTLFYFCYAGVEPLVGLWGGSYLADELGAHPATAAVGVTVFWSLLAAGRFGMGIFADRVRAETILRAGIFAALAGGCVFVFAPGVTVFCFAMAVTGLGISPLYPVMMHDTPARVGRALSDRVVGFQVGAALSGSAVVPLAFGYAAKAWGLRIFGYAVVVFAFFVLCMHEVSFRHSLRRGK